MSTTNSEPLAPGSTEGFGKTSPRRVTMESVSRCSFIRELELVQTEERAKRDKAEADSLTQLAYVHAVNVLERLARRHYENCRKCQAHEAHVHTAVAA